MTELGDLSLWLALVMAVWGATLSAVGDIQRRGEFIASGERALFAAAGFLVLSAAGLWTALLRSDLSYLYVASFSSTNLPAIYRLAAFWSGPAGSLLFWCLVLALYTVIAMRTTRHRLPALAPLVAATVGAVLACFVAWSALGANPFARMPSLPSDGRGLEPQLQSGALAIHPPLLYLGAVATVVPFAIVLATLVKRRADAAWIADVRGWATVAWCFLTAGALVGMWWAYAEVGWGGYWSWDPVESAVLLPWACGAVFVMAASGRASRNGFRPWAAGLGLAMFPLTLLVAFIARSGVVRTTHSFVHSPPAAVPAVLAIVAAVAGVWLFVTRRAALVAAPGAGGSPGVPPIRRVGVRVAQAGAVVMVLAFIGPAFRSHHDVVLADGESARITDPFGRQWTFTSAGVSRYEYLNRFALSVALMPSVGGVRQRIIASEQRHVFDSDNREWYPPSTKVGIRSTPLEDVYVQLADFGNTSATLRITFNPFVLWVWAGGALLVLGGVITLLPGESGGGPEGAS